MMVLQQMFKECKPPRPKDLPGDWMLIRHIMTAKFLKQPNGRDHQTFNIQGIRRDKSPGTPLEWTMSIGAAKNGRLRVTSHTQWEPTGDVSPLTFNSAGDMLFTKDYGHDSKWVYRCRAGSPTRLVCLLKDHEAGHGLEFTKMPPPSAAKPASAPAH